MNWMAPPMAPLPPRPAGRRWLIVGSWVTAVTLLVGCSQRGPAPLPGAKDSQDLATAAAIAPDEPVDLLLHRLSAADGSSCPPERVGELFELASLLTTRDRALATTARAQATARLALQALASCSGGQQGTVLAVLGVLAATWPEAQQALYDGGAAAQLRRLLAEEVAELGRQMASQAVGE